MRTWTVVLVLLGCCCMTDEGTGPVGRLQAMPRRLSSLREGPLAGRLQEQLRHLFEALSAKVTGYVTEYR
jgi:hypothetical protein